MLILLLQKEDYSDAFQFTPVEVAKYLYQTGNFQELTQALSDLVNASIVSIFSFRLSSVEIKQNLSEIWLLNAL